ncbi:MAG: anti-sigma regulatory factor [Clostridia bacterium]
MEKINLNFLVDGTDFMSAGEASGEVKRVMKRLGMPSDLIRKTSIAMYEGEINMVIHANGGEANVSIDENKIEITLTDFGPGIPDVEKAMQEGYSTAPDNVRSLGFGAGMGLPNIKKYTDTLDIKSVVGKGTTLSMTILNK